MRAFVYRPRDTEAGLKQELDRITPLIVKTRDGWQCVMCGRSDVTIESGHVFGRTHRPSRWLLENNFAQCVYCNRAHNIDPNPYLFYYIRRFGSEAMGTLRDIAYSTHDFTFSELEMLVAQYKLIYRLLLKGWSFTSACREAGYELFIEFEKEKRCDVDSLFS
jgi:hypothetical protein